jgi:drug/metabolite transporter (DMT)-like permease
MIVGALLLLGGNGNVVWAEQRVPSGLAALLVATEPLWIVVLNWVRPGGIRPSGRIALGLAVGFAGVALLVGPGSLMGGSSVDLMGAGALTLAALSWAAGSLYVTRARLPASPIMAAAAEMLAGGTLLLLAGFLTGEAGRVQLSAISLRSIVSVGYLIIFGSLVGFTAYNWLLGVTTPARASTYAYVNPVVAVLLGWAVAGEPLSIRMLLAAAVIIAAVVLITTHRLPRAARAEKKLIASATPADPFIRDAVPAHRNGVGKRPADVIKDAPVAGSIDPVGHHIEERHESR